MQEDAPPPIFKLIHGLPGSGKNRLLKWLRSYFIEVCGWEEGVHFQYIAPMNSMADNIGGNTLHSWAEIVWEDKRGRQVKNRGSTEDNMQLFTLSFH